MPASSSRQHRAFVSSGLVKQLNLPTAGGVFRCMLHPRKSRRVAAGATVRDGAAVHGALSAPARALI